ncbi:MAG: type I methionyl aminopeptidase [Verrucomicrobia bacterium]|nr:type I methionyl aminopeptidase [Verrucomicrobiota bacterium]
MIIYKSDREIAKLAEAGRLTAEILDAICRLVAPGVTTKDLEQEAVRLMAERGVESAFKGYRGYPGVICTSVNEEVVHGIPGPRKLVEGDVVSLDVGIRHEGFIGDTARTVPVGEVDELKRRLLESGRRCLEAAIAVVDARHRLGDVSHAVQSTAEAAGFSVVRAFVGHGVGRDMHEEPQVRNYGKPGSGPPLARGMVFAIEPMVNAGSHEVRVLDDEWTAVTVDGQPSVHFEHTVAVTRDGHEVLTACPKTM